MAGVLAKLQERALADRMDALQRLTAGFAHELRNPLNAARLQLEVLARRSQRMPAADDPLTLALVELQTLAELVDDFLLFAKPSPLEAEDHDIALLLEQAIDGEREFARERDVALSVVANVRCAAVTVDAPKVVFVVEELLHNAIEAVEPSGHVAVVLDARIDTVHITVRDNGAGIPAGLEHRIYEPFFSTRDHRRGLGLAIVHSFVGLHCGRIAVASGPTGTCFAVTLPRAPTS